MLQWRVCLCVWGERDPVMSVFQYVCLIFVVALPSVCVRACTCVLYTPWGHSVSQTAVWWPGNTPPLPPSACHTDTLPHTHTQTPSHTHGSAACLPPLVSPSHRTHRHSNAVTVRHLQSHTQYTSRSSNILHLPLKVDAKPSQLMIFDH